MSFGIIFGVILIAISWCILYTFFYESRRVVAVLFVVFYIISFVLFKNIVSEAPDWETTVFLLVTVMFCFRVAPMYLVFGIPILIFLKSSRKGASGIKDIHGKRVTEDIPTSAIKTGAMGSYVEVKGKLIGFKRYLRDDKSLAAPWRLSHRSFFIDDGSGSYALVDPSGAELILDDRKLRLQDEVYVRGYAESGLDYQAKLEVVDWLDYMIRLIPNNRALAKRFDTNQDGVLDDNELKSGAETLSREWKTKSYTGLMSETKMIFRSSVKHPLIISTKKEKDLTTFLNQRSGIRMVLGIIYLVLTFLVFGALCSSNMQICKIGLNLPIWSCNTSDSSSDI